MAAGLEGAATFIGILGFSTQCVNGLITLKRALADIQDAPHHLRKIRGDIDRLHRILLDLKQQHDAMGILGPPNPIWDDTRLDCRDAADDLEEVVSDLLRTIGKRKIPGAIIAVLKKDVVKRHQDRLDRIKQDLMLAQVSFMTPRIGLLVHYAAARHAITPHQLNQVSHLIESEAADAIVQPRGPTQTSTSTVPKWSPSESQNLHQDRLRARARRQKTWEMQLTFKWLWNSVVRVQCDFSQGRFGFGATYHNMLPCTAPVFDAVISGDVERLQYMFDHHQASINDVNEDGWSLLDVGVSKEQMTSCLQNQIALCPTQSLYLRCRYCSRWGLRPILSVACRIRHGSSQHSPRMINFLAAHELKPTYQTFQLFWFQRVNNIEATDESSRDMICADLTRLLISHSNHLLIENPSDYIDMFFNDTMIGVTSASTQLLASVFPPYDERPALERWRCFSQGTETWRWPKPGSSKHYLPWLGKDGFNARFVHDLSAAGCSYMLEGIATNVSHCFQRAYPPRSPSCRRFDQLESPELLFSGVQFWEDFIKSASEFGAFELLLGADPAMDWSSPLKELLSVTRFQCIESELLWKSHILRHWLQILFNAGVDLQGYGQLEQALVFRIDRNPLFLDTQRHPEVRQIRIVGLSVGHTPSDWEIWYDCPFDGWAADFWVLIEPELTVHVPGSWIDEQQESLEAREARTRAKRGSFKSLATSRRKRRRYLRFMGISDADARKSLGPLWETMTRLNAEHGRDCNPLKGWPMSSTYVRTNRSVIQLFTYTGHDKRCQHCGKKTDRVLFDLTDGGASVLCQGCLRCGGNDSVKDPAKTVS